MIKPSTKNLIWIDLEMTGLNPAQDRVIEIATIITDAQLNILAEGPAFAIYQSDAVLSLMDDWNAKHHGDSGLIDRVKVSHVTEEQAQAETIEFLMHYVPPQKSPMCGNSVCQDRRFLHRWMPKLEQYFHYRNLDVSTIKILAQRWAPDIYKSIKKKSRHLARADILDSIAELQYYKDHFLRYSATN